MKVMIFGASNALGRRFCELSPFEVIKATRSEVAYTNIDSLYSFIKQHRPDVVVNTSALKSASSTVEDMILINSLFPHLLAKVCKVLDANVYHISTDAIFSGRNKYKNTVDTHIDPTTYYGKTRALGEVLAPNVCVVRTAYVGVDSGIVNWLVTQPNGAQVDGWVNFKWSGSTIEAVCEELFAMIGGEFKNGVEHLSTEQATSKFDLVLSIIKKFGLDLRVRPTYHPYINRALVPTRVIQSLEEALYANDCSFNLQTQPTRR